MSDTQPLPSSPPTAPVGAGQHPGSRYAGGPYPGGPSSGGPSTGGPGPYTGGMGGPPPGSPTPPGAAGSGFFASLRGQGLVRPDDRVVAGVAAALARRAGIDPLLVRVAFVVLTVVGGVGILLYGLGWLLLPQEDGRIHAQSLLAGTVTAGTVGALVALVLGVGGLEPPWAWADGDPGFGFGGFVALAAIVLVIVVLAVGHQSGWFRGGPSPATPGSAPGAGGQATSTVNLTKGATAWTPTGAVPSPAQQVPATPLVPPVYVPPVYVPPAASSPPPRPKRRTPGALGTLLAAGLALVAAGTVVAVDSVEPLTVDVGVVAWASALAVLAACLLALGLSGRRSGGVGALAVIALLGTTFASIDADGVQGGPVGQRRWAPTGESSSYAYRLGSGEAVLDLGSIEPGRSTPVEVEVDLSVGELVVRVPDDLTVDLEVTSGIGEIRGAAEGNSLLGPAGSPDVVLDADVSVGELVIQEVSR